VGGEALVLEVLQEDVLDGEGGGGAVGRKRVRTVQPRLDVKAAPKLRSDPISVNLCIKT
jgi:hypothetical protein